MLPYLPLPEQLSEQHCCCFENHENVEGFQDLQPYHQQLPIMEKKNMSNEHTKSLEQKKLLVQLATNHFYKVEPEVSCFTIGSVQKLIGFVNLLVRK